MKKTWDAKDFQRFGADFIPSNAINQLEMWQADTFDPETIDRELGWAAAIGMSVMRVYLHDLLWEDDAAGFLKRMDEYLTIAAKHGIKTMFVFFDDCWNTEFQLGKQPDPIPETHNSGWVQSPGNRAADDLSQRPRLEAYVKGVLRHFAHDERILLWDLYNEPGNGESGDHVTLSGLRENRSMPLVQDVFRWAREIDPDQPLTIGLWNFSAGFDDLNRYFLEHSDVVTFHSYDPAPLLQERINWMRICANGRPILCSEYMARINNSLFQTCLPLLEKNGVGAINWGLVAGKTQTIYPWKCYKDRPNLKPFHDIFQQDGSFLLPEDEEFFRERLKK